MDQSGVRDGAGSERDRCSALGSAGARSHGPRRAVSRLAALSAAQGRVRSSCSARCPAQGRAPASQGTGAAWAGMGPQAKRHQEADWRLCAPSHRRGRKRKGSSSARETLEDGRRPAPRGGHGTRREIWPTLTRIRLGGASSSHRQSRALGRRFRVAVIRLRDDRPRHIWICTYRVHLVVFLP
jgi:hypothetical protein